MRSGPYTDSAAVVAQALSFASPDRMPVFDGFQPGFEQRWRAKRRPLKGEGIEEYYWVDLKVSVADETFLPSQTGVVREDGGNVYRNDGWGRVVRTRPGAHFKEPVARMLQEPADLDRITFELANMDARYEGLVAEAGRQHSLGRAVFVGIGGPYSRSWWLRGEEEFLTDLVTDKGFARAVIARVADHLLGVGLESLRRTGAHVSGVWIHDDLCRRSGPTFSSKVFEELLLPAYHGLVSQLKKAGARRVILHSGGDITPLLGSLIAAGIDGVNPVEYDSGMVAAELVERYHGRLCFIGGVCNTHILPRGDAEAIRRHVTALLEAGRRGGLILGTPTVGPNISVESYELYRRMVAPDAAGRPAMVAPLGAVRPAGAEEPRGTGRQTTWRL